MGKHSKPDEEESFSGDLKSGELKPQLADKSGPLDGLADVSQSPIDTF